jgi:hypothetical protein
VLRCMFSYRIYIYIYIYIYIGLALAWIRGEPAVLALGPEVIVACAGIPMITRCRVFPLRFNVWCPGDVVSSVWGDVVSSGRRGVLYLGGRGVLYLG